MRRRDVPRGQALVEFALVMPLLMFMLLGFAEAAFLFATLHEWQDGADVLADNAAAHIAQKPGPANDWFAHWQQVVKDEQDRVGCKGSPTIDYPDGADNPGDRVRVTWTCRYEPHAIPGWGGVSRTITGEAVIWQGPPPKASSKPSEPPTEAPS